MFLRPKNQFDWVRYKIVISINNDEFESFELLNNELLLMCQATLPEITYIPV